MHLQENPSSAVLSQRFKWRSPISNSAHFSPARLLHLVPSSRNRRRGKKLLRPLATFLIAGALFGCSRGNQGNDEPFGGLADEVRAEALEEGLLPIDPAPSSPAERVELGRLLAFDKILSGNQDISCMTCHHPGLGTADARSLSIGVGGEGLGAGRVHPENARIRRNAPALFNLHAQPVLFWDGRISEENGELVTPAGDALTAEMRETLDGSVVAAQVLFPVLSRDEMRGRPGENELAAIRDEDPGQVWEAIMQRLGAIPEYVERFEAAFPGEAFEDMTFAHAAVAIAAFETTAFDASETRWDQFLRGDDLAMSQAELQGAALFMGRGRCTDCHDGASLSDFEMHNTLVPQVGAEDTGAEEVTGDPRDRFAFRTPPLRNVELTAPYGHNGTFVTLEDFLEHYDDPEDELMDYNPDVLEPALRSAVVPNQLEMLETRSNDLRNVNLGGQALSNLHAFMEALTDEETRDTLSVIPNRVPSGLPVND